jgi:ribosomal protein S18 acetylase RimI-like enzyme
VKGHLKLEGAGVILRTITPADLEFLRLLKNSNTHAFFHKEQIAPEQQARWFEGYLERPDDFVFVVNETMGSVAARLKDGEVDCYNIMAAPQAKGKGLMKTAMKLLTDWAGKKWKRPISLLVVDGNDDVLGFYSKCGFTKKDGAAGGTKLTLEVRS